MRYGHIVCVDERTHDVQMMVTGLGATGLEEKIFFSRK